MALVGFQIEKQKIEDRIQQLQAALKGKRTSLSSAGAKSRRVKRVLSPEARKRIAAAQRKRWAEHSRMKVQQAKQE